jgi:hypothetical protein
MYSKIYLGLLNHEGTALLFTYFASFTLNENDNELKLAWDCSNANGFRKSAEAKKQAET